MAYDRIYNFSAGPAVLPEPVLERVRDNILNYNGSGLGMMEMSHRSALFTEIIEGAERDLRDLLAIPDSHAVLFIQGGASMQFAMVPLNLLGPDQTADYILTGSWSKLAAKEAGRIGSVHVAASSEEIGFVQIPTEIQMSADPAYVHITSNNTIVGTQYKNVPDCAGAPLVSDASSDFLHKKIDVSKFALIYAGAQKNIGPAGVVVVVVNKDVLAQSRALRKSVPTMLDYRTYIESGSLYNTPPTFTIYVVAEVLRWIKANGGMAAVEKRNSEKAKVLYDALDASGFYKAVVADKESRSCMNVTFRLPSEELEKKFVTESGKAGLSGLGGHRSVGGARASIYNAFPIEGVRALVSFMKEFEQKNG